MLRGYVAGQQAAERAAAAVAEAYYRGSAADRAALQPLLDIIDRLAPGMVELTRTAEGSGFLVRPAGRPFPVEGEVELRRVAGMVLAAPWGAQREAAPVAVEGLLGRLVAVVRRLFSAGS